MKNFFKWLTIGILSAIAVVIVNHGLTFNSDLFLCIFVIFVVVIFAFCKKISAKIKEHKNIIPIVCIILLIAGLALRLSFLFIDNRFSINHQLEDTGVHWYGAQQIVDNGEVDQIIGEYENLFPYLSTYTVTLALSMCIFGKNILSIIILNSIFDIVGCISLYILFSKWKNNKKVGLFAATIWAINPLEIIFCSLPLAIVITNNLILLNILCMFMLWTNKESIKKSIPYSIIYAILLALGNAYRPIFIIFLIATLLFFVINLFQKRNKNINIITIINSAVLIFFYIITGLIPNVIHGQINPYFNKENAHAGWSVFVGANYDTAGKWSREDNGIFFSEILPNTNNDVKTAQQTALSEGIDRYKDMLLKGNFLQHMFNKISVLFCDIKNSVHDLPYAYNFSKNNVIYMVAQDVISIFYYLLIAITMICFYDKIKNKNWPDAYTIEFWIIIAFVGLFAASLLVEVMNRYVLPFVAIFSIIAIKFIVDKFNRVIS